MEWPPFLSDLLLSVDEACNYTVIGGGGTGSMGDLTTTLLVEVESEAPCLM